MPTAVLKADDERDYREAVERGAQLIRDGGLVVFPTETVYGLAARGDCREAVGALRRVKGRDDNKPFTVHIGRPDAVKRYVPTMSAVGARLARRAWPGPLTLVFPVGDEQSAAVVQECGAAAAELMYHEGSIGIRCPDDRLAAEMLTAAGVPVVAASANRAGRPAPYSVVGALAELEGLVDLVVDGGRTRYAKPSTVVRVAGEDLEILRAGVWDERTVKRLASLNILFVCSGNTCRSPMAASLCRKVVAERLGCPEAELAARRVWVWSTGAMTAGGSPAAVHAVTAMSRRGLDLSGHVSSPLDEDDIHQADHVLCMTRAHVAEVLAQVPSAGDKTQLLGGDSEIQDPFGGSEADYEACAATIEEAVKKRLTEIPL